MNSEEKLHILVIPSFYSSDEEPVKGSFFKEQSESIKNLGMNVGMIFPELRSIKNISMKKFMKNHFQTKLYNENGVNIYRKHRWNVIPTKFMLGDQLWVNSALTLADKYIKKFGKPDLIHAHCALWAGYAAKIVSERYGIPYIVTEHSTAYARDMVSDKKKSIAQLVFNSADKVVVVSNPFKELLQNNLNIDPNRMMVIPNFIDTNYFTQSPINRKEHEDFTFLSVAFLNEKKGMDKLLNAFSQEFKGNRNVRLKIGGDGPDRKKLEELSGKLEIQSQVEFLGTLSREKVKENMCMADCFVLASNVETFGVVFIEAMATGAPIIATRSGGPEDIVTDEVGYLVDNVGIEELSSAMKDVYKNYNKFDSDVIRRYVESNFSNNVVSNRILDLYKQVIK